MLWIICERRNRDTIIIGMLGCYFIISVERVACERAKEVCVVMIINL